MKFEITEEQINALLQVLGEIPSKLSFNVIMMLKQLPQTQVPKEGTD